MQQLLRHKHLRLKLTGLLSALVLSLSMFAPLAAAVPLQYFADPQTGSCDLYTGAASPTGTGVFQSEGIGNGETCCPTANEDPIQCLFDKYATPVVQLLSALVGVVVVVAVIAGAIEYITSAGDPQKAAAGRSHITNALLGLLAYAFLYAFLQFIIPGGLLNAG